MRKRKKYTIEDMKAAAKTKNGECLSLEYINMRTKLEWQCKENHIWKTNPQAILSGQWCPICYEKKRGASQRKTIEDMQKLAESKGGKCLSKKHINVKTKLEWQCFYGHKWFTAPNNIITKNSWCPKCYGNRNINEERCRFIFEFFTGKKFELLRKMFNSKFELDGYCQELKLAFEYHGEQHYKVISYFCMTEQDLMQRKKDDTKKKRICKKNKINLIVIPYKKMYKNNEISFIYNKIKSLNIKTIHSIDEFSYLGFWTNNSKLEKAKQIAIKRGGKFLTEAYLGSKQKMEWECKNKHRWLANYNNIINGSWCYKCLFTKHSIEEAQRVAKINGGICLSDFYKNGTNKLLWECKNKHKWKATLTSAKKTWCIRCKGHYKDIKIIKDFAKTKGGECLSNIYGKILDPLIWKCNKGHIWSSNANNVLNNNHWCPICAVDKTRKYTIEDMKKLAKEKNGECLSEIYISGISKLKWRCSRGHEWFSIPCSVLKGNWCHKCINRKFDHNEIIKLYKQGLSRKEISKQIKCSTATICNVIKRAKL